MQGWKVDTESSASELSAIGYRLSAIQRRAGASAPTVSVVIPNLHSPLIGEVIAALEQQTARRHLREVIVVGQDRYGRVPSGVQFLVTPQPLCAAAARNLGARHARGDYLLFLDADCIAAPDLVEHMLARQRQGYPVVGGSVVLEPGSFWRVCDNLLSFAPFLSSRPAGTRRYLPSLNLGMARELFLQAGGFDEHFPGAAGEDVDLSLRLHRHGCRLFFEPRARVYHRAPRLSAGRVWQHLRAFGRVHVRLQRLHAGRAAPRLDPRWRPWAGMILALAPFLALLDVLALYRSDRALWRYWYALPGLVWGKLAWYWGAAEALMVA